MKSPDIDKQTPPPPDDPDPGVPFFKTWSGVYVFVIVCFVLVVVALAAFSRIYA